MLLALSYTLITNLWYEHKVMLLTQTYFRKHLLSTQTLLYNMTACLRHKRYVARLWEIEMGYMATIRDGLHVAHLYFPMSVCFIIRRCKSGPIGHLLRATDHVQIGHLWRGPSTMCLRCSYPLHVAHVHSPAPKGIGVDIKKPDSFTAHCSVPGRRNC